MKDSIFVVEDDKDDMSLLHDAFEAIGWENTQFFSSPLDLMKALKSADGAGLPQLVVTDYNMPKLNGFNIVAFLKQNEEYSSIKTVVLTGSVIATEKERLLNAGVSKVFLKPSSFTEYKTIASELVSMVKS